MNIIFYIVMLIGGFVLLWLSSDKAVLYSIRIANYFQLSKLLIGFVILAIATGLPELFVTIQALLVKNPELSVGNIIGSNFADIALALGLCPLLVKPIIMQSNDHHEKIVLFILCFAVTAYTFINGHITRLMGVVLLTTYIVGIAWLWKYAPIEHHEEKLNVLQKDTRNGVLMKLAFALTLVMISSKICVDSALVIADFFSIPTDILGVSFFAAGTSLPEIVLNIQAIKKNNPAFALGNSLGSIFVQGAFILGILAVFADHPLPLGHLNPIIPFFALSMIITGYHIMRKKPMKKLSGIVLVSLYVLFIVYELFFVPY